MRWAAAEDNLYAAMQCQSSKVSWYRYPLLLLSKQLLQSTTFWGHLFADGLTEDYKSRRFWEPTENQRSRGFYAV